MKNLPNLKFHTRIQKYFADHQIPMWLKLIHLFILIDSKSKAKDGYTIWYQNPSLQKKFSLYVNDVVVWQPSIENIQKSIAKLEKMDLIIRTVSSNGERRIKLNRVLIVKFLSEYNIDTDLYKSFKDKSRERKLIRRKILTIVDFINLKKSKQSEQFKKYLQYQNKKYGYEIDLPEIDLLDINMEQDKFITPAEMDYYSYEQQQSRALDAVFNSIR